MIILHYTAGVSAQSSPRYLARPDVKASAHLVIGRLGKIIQLVSFDVEAWHAGQSSYAGRTCLNRFSIGIELDNLGRLAWSGGRFVAECGREVELEQVASISILVTWEIFSEISLAVCSEAAEADETAMDQEEVLM